MALSDSKAKKRAKTIAKNHPNKTTQKKKVPTKKPKKRNIK